MALGVGAQAPAAKPVRCAATSRALCVVVEGNVPALRDSGTARALELRLGLPEFTPPSRAMAVIRPAAYLLVLLDVSGSMSGRGIAFTRQPLDRFLAGLPASSVRVAVVPFGSKGVTPPIEGASFVSPERARAVLQAVPPPSPEANTALYSAIFAGAQVLGRQEPGVGVQRLMLVVTDGRNDVDNPGDDPGLLGDEALPAVREALRSSGCGDTRIVSANQPCGVKLALLGLGDGVAEGEMRSLAADLGRSYISPLTPLEVDERLGAIASQFADWQQLTFATGSDLGSIGRLVRRTGIFGDGSDAPILAVSWDPPALALPAFTGVAAGEHLDEVIGVVVDTTDPLPLERLVHVALVVVLLVLCWSVVPGWLWPRTVSEAEVVREAGEAVAPRGGVPVSGLRTDAREAAPRRPDQVTGEFPALR